MQPQVGPRETGATRRPCTAGGVGPGGRHPKPLRRDPSKGQLRSRLVHQALVPLRFSDGAMSCLHGVQLHLPPPPLAGAA